MIPRIGAMLRRRFHRAGLSERRCELASASVRCFVGDTGGPPLLLLMGFGASVEWQFHPNVAALARRHQLIIPDLVHFGGSKSEETPCLEMQTRVAFELLDHLGVRSADVLGLSYGGFVALWMASDRPSRVERLVLVACPGPASRAEPPATPPLPATQ